MSRPEEPGLSLTAVYPLDSDLHICTLYIGLCF